MTHPEEASYTPTGAIDLGDGWTKSSFSISSGACVEVKTANDGVLIRDSKLDASTGKSISINATQWKQILSDLKRGSQESVLLVALDDGSVGVAGSDGARLTFSRSEWTAFASGVVDGQFDQGIIN